ncbi:MAG TPA: MFS transporter [Bacillus sp. (in: firmicutes)]|uniref:MFS transporter n=1 Tax=Bacillus litorisediminis TaxID=2922713 RepID=UPI001FAE2720|nr:MFS transporter [Bacillus litorisediminis]HWO74580.1 MFS transporter [Bacillus sp. (in: firmicutes)]
MKKILGLFQNETYRNLFLANVLSQLGSIIGMTAFTLYLLDRFSSQPVYATITEMMYSLPTLFVFFLVGVFADKLDRQRIAYSCDLICAVLSVALLLAITTGWMPFVFFILFLRSAIQKFFFPAEHSMIQGILKSEDYATAAGLNQMVNSLFMLFGSGIGVVLYWTIGLYGAVIIDASTFMISAILIRKLSISESVRLPNGNHSLKDINYSFIYQNFKEGLIYILKHKLLLTLIFGFFLFGIVNGGFSVMILFILKYKISPESYEELSAIVGIIFGAGALLGGFLASIWAQKMKLYKMAILGLLLSGSFTFATAFAASFWVLAILFFCVGFVLPLVNVGIGGWMPSIVDPKMMGRVQGWISPLTMLAQSIMLGFIAVSFPAYISIEVLYWIVGLALIIVGSFYGVQLPKYADTETTSEPAAEVNATV